MVTFDNLLSTVQQIRQIVHTPTKKTNHKTASDHYQSDFDQIRRLCEQVLSEAGVKNEEGN